MLATLAARLERKKDIQGALEAHAQAERISTAEKIRLQWLVDAAASGMMITDKDGKILWVNPAFTQLTGFTPEQAIAKTRACSVRGGTRRNYAQLWATIGGGKVWHGELVNKRKDGTLLR